MRRPAPLPDSLRAGPFTLHQAHAAGVHRDRLHRSYIVRLARGLYVWRGTSRPSASTTVSPAGSASRPRVRPHPTIGHDDPYEWSTPLTVAQHDRLVRLIPHRHTTALSHQTAARARGLWLPARLDHHDAVHVSRPRDRGQLTADGVVSHRTLLPREEVEQVLINGQPWWTTTLPRLWVDLAAQLTDRELVVLGDHLVRCAELDGGVDAATSRRGELIQVAASCRTGRRHRRRLIAAAATVRVGAHSPRETLLRLALVEAGLPEPELQIEMHDPSFSPTHPASADLGYRSARLALHYDSKHHGRPRQIDRDVQRNAAFERRGYRNLTVSTSDGRDGYRRVIDEVRRHLTAHSAGNV